MEGASADHLVGDESKPTLYLIEPGSPGRREVEVEAVALPELSKRWMAALLCVLVVVENEMAVEFRRHLLFELIEKLMNSLPRSRGRQLLITFPFRILKANSVVVPCRL